MLRETLAGRERILAAEEGDKDNITDFRRYSLERR